MASPATPAVSTVDPAVNSGVRRFGWYCCLAMLFLRYTRLLDFLSTYGLPNTRLLYILTVPALLALIGSGGLRRAFSHSSSRFWLAFVAWMLICIPFSTWRGGAAEVSFTYIRAEILLLPLVAGLPMTWKEWRMALYTIALASVVNVGSALLFGQTYGTLGRIGLDNQTLGNPNDYAGHLLMVLPMALFMLIHPGRAFFARIAVRMLMAAAVAYGCYLILASGSRGAFLGVMLAVGFGMVKAGGKGRTMFLVAIPVAAIAFISLIPRATLSRLFSYSSNVSQKVDDATLSAALREQLLRKGIITIATHPVFGVGPGEFGNYQVEGESGRLPTWGNAHNSYIQVAADMGIPGLLLYLAGTLSSFFLLQRLWKRVRRGDYPEEVSTACFCLSAAWVAFCVAIAFLNFAYFFYLPAFCGLIVSLMIALEHSKQLVPTPATVESRLPTQRTMHPARFTPAFPPATASPVRGSSRFRMNGYRRS